MLLINILLWIGQILAPHNAGAAHLPHGDLLTREQANTFLLAAMHAETIKNPLRRCLAYPDPPGSHWDRAAVKAYCKYRFQPIITLAQIRHLVHAGKTATLDRLFAKALHAQETDPDARGRLDRIFYADFHHPSAKLRALLDEWKAKAPDSAFALAASGYEYDKAAGKARGSDYLTNTPRENIAAMDTLSDLADTDLQKAVSLNAAITPAWAAMIELGGFDRGERYGMSAVKRGLAAGPDNYDIYSAWMWFRQPNWYGSYADMDRVLRDALKHAEANPRLKMLIPSKDFYRVDHCHCEPGVELPAYVAALANAAGYSDLADAGESAFDDAGNYPMSAIYLSEALRFDPQRHDDRIDRVHAMAALGFTPWALREANALVARYPGNEFAHKVRAITYFTMGNLARAKQDFERTTELAPDDYWAWMRLGNIEASLGEWDQAWSVANLLVKRDPGHAAGLNLRARIQIYQPRKGLTDTVNQLEARFGTYPDVAKEVVYLREVVAGKIHPRERMIEGRIKIEIPLSRH